MAEKQTLTANDVGVFDPAVAAGKVKSGVPTIIHIVGPAKSGKTTVAQALRSLHLNQHRGVLLIDEQQEAKTADLILKIMTDVPTGKEKSAADFRWKDDPVVILVGDQSRRLKEIEEIVPGFAKKFGKVYSISTSAKS